MLLFTSGDTEINVAQENGQVVEVDVAAARQDIPPDEGDCQRDFRSTDPRPCSFGPDDADVTMAVFGDSHATQWLDMFVALADERSWRLDIYSKAGCGPSSVPQWHLALKAHYKDCAKWREGVLDRLTDSPARPDVVVVAARSGTTGFADGERVDPVDAVDDVTDGLEETFRRLTDSGLPVAVLDPTPAADFDVPLCVSENAGDPTECAFDLESGYPAGDPAERVAADRVDGVEFVEVSDIICPDGVCAAVQRGTVVFRDDNHLTNTFVDRIREDVLERFSDSGAFDGVGSSEA
jgi:hypothetical protein